MKAMYSDAKKRRIEVFEEFKSLWKLDDPDWVAQRKEEWRNYVGDEGGYPNLKYAGRYYVYGEEPPSYIQGDGVYDETLIKFDFGQRLSHTPLETKEQVRRMWDLEVSNFSVRAESHHAKAEITGRNADLLNSVAKVKMITEALFCPELFLYEHNGYVVTVDPADFVIGYASVGFLYNKSAIEADYRCFSFDYFKLCVKYCDEHSSLSTPRSKKALPKMYEALLGYDDSQLNSYKLELKKKLLEAAEAEESPQILKQALSDAKKKLGL